MSEPLPPAPHGFQRLVTVRKIGEGGLAQSVEPGAAEIPKIALFLDLVRIDAVRVEYKLFRWRAKGIRLTGQLLADVVQTCVVSLEPVAGHIDVAFERKYLPPDLLGPNKDETDVHVDPIAEDPPEPLGHEIDLGEVLVEELSLNLDPYPRKAGSALDSTLSGEAGVRESPFAALAKLRGKLTPKA